jgi:hypothetical protein
VSESRRAFRRQTLPSSSTTIRSAIEKIKPMLCSTMMKADPFLLVEHLDVVLQDSI